MLVELDKQLIKMIFQTPIRVVHVIKIQEKVLIFRVLEVLNFEETFSLFYLILLKIWCDCSLQELHR